MGNVGFYTTIAEGNKSHDYGQIYSRIGVRVIKDKPTDKDVTALLHAWGIGDNSIHAFMKKIARSSGALRNVKKRLSLATMLAKGADESLSIAHIEQAHVNLSWS